MDPVEKAPDSSYNDGQTTVSNQQPEVEMVQHPAEMLEITVNGERRSVPAGLNLRDLLNHLGMPADRVAIELNRLIVRQPAWDSTPVEPGAEIEIVHFVGGG